MFYILNEADVSVEFVDYPSLVPVIKEDFEMMHSVREISFNLSEQALRSLNLGLIGVFHTGD